MGKMLFPYYSRIDHANVSDVINAEAAIHVSLSFAVNVVYEGYTFVDHLNCVLLRCSY